MTEPRIIKKYPNRRLYDTKESRYITLVDVRALVMDHEDFEVVDQKSGDNLTCGILLQVMAEQVNNSQTAISRDVIAQMIRVYSGNLPEALRAYLQESLSLFLEQHQRIDALLGRGAEADLVGALAELAQQNLSRWIDVNKALLRAVGENDRPEPAPSREPLEA